MALLQKDRVKIPGTAVIHKPGSKLVTVVKDGVTVVKDGISNYRQYLCSNDKHCRGVRRILVLVVAAILASLIVLWFHKESKLGEVGQTWSPTRQLYYDQTALSKSSDDERTIGEVSPPLPKSILSLMNNTELYHYYRGLISLLTYRCENKRIFGVDQHVGRSPGEEDHRINWMVCQDEPVKLRAQDCLVYSFGLNWDFTFEDSIGSELGCDVYTHDPTHADTPPGKKKNGYYYPVALDGTKEDAGATWRVKSLSEILDRNDHDQEDIDVLKLDLDGNEWQVLENMIENDRPFKRIRQMALGVNLYKDEMTASELRHRIVILEKLTKLGFRLFEVQDLGSGRYYNHRVKHDMTCCSTLHFINVRHRNYEE